MSRITTNPRVAMSMSDLEVRARKGCPFAQEEMERQAFASASITRKLMKEHSLNRAEAQRELKR